MRFFAVTTVLTGLMLGGCATSLSLSEIDMSPKATSWPPKSVPAGFMYRLPSAIVRPSAFVALRDCKVDEGAAKSLTEAYPAGAKPITEAVFAAGGAIATEQVPDQAVIIDYRELQQFLKTSSIAIEKHPNGMLKSVNASMEDQTPEAIAALAEAAGSVALLATGAPGLLAAAPIAAASGGARPLAPPGGGKAPKPKPRTTIQFAACNAETLDLIAKRKAAAKRRDDATGLLERTSGQAAELGAKPEADAKALDKLKADLANYSAQIDSAMDDIAEIDIQLTLPLDEIASLPNPTSISPFAMGDQVKPSLLKDGFVLTSTKVAGFVNDHFVDASAQIAADQKENFEKRPCRFSKATAKPVIDESCSRVDAIKALVGKVATVSVRPRDMTPLRGDEGTAGAAPARTFIASVREVEDGISGGEVETGRGVIYVEPARLKLDMIAKTVGPASVMQPTRILKTVDVSLPQLGRYLALPLRAGFGERVELQATFAEDGSLLTATFANPKTSGKALAETLKSVAATGVSSRDAMEERRSSLLKSKAEALTTLVSIKEQSAKLTPATDPLKELSARLAKATAEAEIAEAELRIKTARDKLIAP